MRNDTIKDFYDFLKHEAETNELIGAKENEKHFFRGEINEHEFYEGLRNDCCFPAVVGEGFANDYEEEKNGIWKRRETVFSVVDSYEDTDDWDQLTNVYSVCETIGDDILGKLIDLYRSENCIVLVTNAQCDQLENLPERWAGLRYRLEISSFWKGV